MGEVLTYSVADWLTMKALKEDLNFMVKKDAEKFSLAIKWTKRQLKRMYANKEN